MIAASFQFEQFHSDAEFTRLDDEIMTFCEGIPGFIKKMKWHSPNGKTINVVYYFESQTDLQQLMKLDAHKEAKSRNAEWYSSYSVELYQVIAEYSSQSA